MFRSYRYIRPRLSDKNFWLVSWNIISIILRNNSCLSLIHPVKLNLNTNLWYKFNYSQHSTSLRIYKKHILLKITYTYVCTKLGFSQLCWVFNFYLILLFSTSNRLLLFQHFATSWPNRINDLVNHILF